MRLHEVLVGEVPFAVSKDYVVPDGLDLHFALSLGL